MAALVISLNPAVDCEWRVANVLPEEKNEILAETRWPGGKGINVARWLKWLRVESRLFLPLGGDTGRELAAGLRTEGIRFDAFPMAEPNRVNVVVTPDQGAQYRFNQTRPRLKAADLRRLVNEASTHACKARSVIISGTLAFGAPVNSYARIAQAARKAGRRVFLDCDREPFVRALAAGPFLVKPNEYELAQWAGRPLRTEAARRQAAGALSTLTGGYVLVSRGARGALLVHAREGLQLNAPVPEVSVRNTVGAGDALLAGAIAAVEQGAGAADLLRWAVATGCAATEVVPGSLPSRRRWKELWNQVVVR